MTTTIPFYAKELAAVAPFVIRLPEGYIYGPGEMVCGVQAVYPKLQFVFHLLPVSQILNFGSLNQTAVFRYCWHHS